MSAWIIGLGLVGTCAGVASGLFNEMVADWNGGGGTKRPVRNMTKHTLVGAALGAGLGWLITDSDSALDKAMEACKNNTPAASTMVLTADESGVKCSYLPK